MRAPSALSIVLWLAMVFVFLPRARPQNSSASPSHPSAASSHKPSAPTQAAKKSDPRRAKQTYRRGLKAEREQNWEAAYRAYSEAADWAPGEHGYLLRREVARSHLVQAQADLAERDAISGRLDDARQDLASAHNLDPANNTVRTRLAELNALAPSSTQETAPAAGLAEQVRLAYQPGTRSFDYRGDSKGAYQEVARQFGVEVAFDVDLRPNAVRFEVKGVDFPTAAHLLGAITRTFSKPLTSRLFLVSEDTPQKRRDYDQSVIRTVLLPGSETPEQMTEILRTVRDITGITRVSLDASSRTLTLRASPQAIAVAADLIDHLEERSSEMIIEMEILEMDRKSAREIGITPPQSATIFAISKQQIEEAEQSYQGLIDVIEQIFGSTSIPPIIAFGGGASTFLAELPGTAAHLSELLSTVRYGRRILLRARDGQPATFFVGDRIPVALSSYSPSLSPGSNNGSSSVAPITNYSAGKLPAFVATGVLRNNSSVNDLVVANSGDDTVSVLLGNGDGSFANQVTYPTGADPVGIATGQFDSVANDFLDLAVVNKGSNTVSILLGNGDGTFKTHMTLNTGHAPASVVAANFHDLTSGATDLAVANQADDTVAIFAGNGDGSFQSPTSVSLPSGFEPTALAAVDLNGDGHSDLVVADAGSNTISVMLGNGDGTFQERTDYPTGDHPVFVAAGDFNGDGAPDIVVANQSANTVTVYYNQESKAGVPLGRFLASSPRDFAAGNGPTSIAVADYNLDGSTDLAVADMTDNAVTVLLNAGNQSFSSLSEVSVGSSPVSIASADFNADGRPDVATADNGAAEATVILNSASLFGSGGTPNSIFPGVQYLDVGLKLKATPRIHAGNDIALQLSLEISSLTGESLNTIPIISNENVDQTVHLRENQTAVVAGFLESQETIAHTGTPGVANVPGIGWLDKTANAQDANRELLILVTPRMVRRSARANHMIYAGQGALEGTAGVPEIEQGPPAQRPPVQTTPSEAGQPEQPATTRDGQTPRQAGPQAEPGTQPPGEQASPQQR